MHFLLVIIVAYLFWQSPLGRDLADLCDRLLCGLLALFCWLAVLTLIVVLICATVRAFQGKLFAHAHGRASVEQVEK